MLMLDAGLLMLDRKPTFIQDPASGISPRRRLYEPEASIALQPVPVRDGQEIGH
jgi:hypothetical protein